MIKKVLFTLFVSVSLFGLSLNTLAAEQAKPAQVNNPQQEINHLLTFVGDSGCRFIRNGDEHTPEKSLKHIQKKYSHFKKKIKTAEDFIARSATGSLMSGKPYYVKCPKVEGKRKSAEWLLEELSRFRTDAKPEKITKNKRVK